MNDGLLLGLLGLLLVCKAFFSGSEIALVSSDKVRLRHKARLGNKGAARAVEAMQRPDRMLSTTLIGTNIATIALSTLGTLALIDRFGDAGEIYAFLLLTPIMLIFGEIVPKSVMQQAADRVVPVIIFPLQGFGLVVRPLVTAFSYMARLVARMVSGEAGDSGLFMTREQLLAIVQTTESSSKLAAFDQGQIRKIIRFGDMSAADMMRPISQTHCVTSGQSALQAAQLACRHQAYTLPVFDEGTTRIAGVAHFTNWDLMDSNLPSRSLQSLVRPALFVSPFQQIADIFDAIMARADGTAVVVDEYGSAIGLLTTRDLISNVLGDIDVGREPWSAGPGGPATRNDDGSLEIDARMTIGDINEKLGIDLSSRDFHTIGGLISGAVGRIPVAGDVMRSAGFRFTVIEASAQAAERVRVEKG